MKKGILFSLLVVIIVSCTSNKEIKLQKSFDKQEIDLKNSLNGTGVEIERSTKKEIKLIAPENVTFDIGSSNIKPIFQTILDEVSKILNEYNDTKIIISGHTDNTGTDEINNPLSEKRAETVAKNIILNGISNDRIMVVGYGSKNPIASNQTLEGRSKNRRVEIKIVVAE